MAKSQGGSWRVWARKAKMVQPPKPYGCVGPKKKNHVIISGRKTHRYKVYHSFMIKSLANYVWKGTVLI